jgi:hypothetical protein
MGEGTDDEVLTEALSDIEAKGADDSGGKSKVDKALEELGFYEAARQLGFDLSPTRGDFTKLLKAILDEGEALEAGQAAALGAMEDFSGGGMRVMNLRSRQQEELTSFWDEALTKIEPFREKFGIDAGAATRAERPADPLEMYFSAVDRLSKEVLGPSPESRFLMEPGVRGAVETTTPTDFQQFLVQQQGELQARYLAETFDRFGPQVKQFAGELAGLPEYDEASDSYPRLTRFLQLREEFNLDEVPSYEAFIQETTPELQSRFKFTSPLSDEDTDAAFRSIFGGELGEGGGQITPFGTFAARQRPALETEFGDVVRSQLEEGAALEALPSFEEFLGEQRGELERTFKLSSPYVTGRTRPGTLNRPTRKV